jgi:hypothetical protein
MSKYGQIKTIKNKYLVPCGGTIFINNFNALDAKHFVENVSVLTVSALCP